MNTAAETVDLTNCDREPIHQLGTIQPFGALVALNSDWIIAHCSTNFAALLGRANPVEVGERLASIVSPDALAQLRSLAANLQLPDHVERTFGLDLTGEGALFDCTVHRSGNHTVIEIEAHVPSDIERQMARLRPIMAQLEMRSDVIAMADEAARQLRANLGMDRVMVYRFGADSSGEVIAESRSDAVEPFLGLRYPATDIPKQARALYVRNRFRLIADVSSDPVAIEPALSVDGTPLDLSMSTLRAVSPIHIEYLRNMGVGASLSISIVVEGKLWGLFACHHYSAKLVPPSQRAAAELFSELFSLVLERTLARERAAMQSKAEEVHDLLMRDIVDAASMAESLPTIDPVIQAIIDHDGASVFVDDVYDRCGAAPEEDEFRAIAPALNSAATSRVLVSDALADHLPKAQAFAGTVTGAVVIPISRTPRDYLVLWRKPLSQTVTWAGNPEKPAEHGEDGVRLSPRKSFAAWQETVEGRAEAWSPTDRQMAERLRVTLLEVILRLTDDAVNERARAQEQQELLIAELNHRVRNILNLIRGLIGQSKGEATDIEGFVDIIGGRIGSLAMAHDNITKGNWSSASLSELIDTEAEAFLAGKTDRLELTGPEAMIAPEAYTVLALVLHEMITNSAKYGSLSDRKGFLSITMSRESGGDLLIDWRESGGPPVSPPQRRGFGSTIIERSIPFELGGTVKIEYPPEGVEAQFLVPSRFVDWSTIRPQKRKPGPDKGDASQGGPVPETVLLVEDSMIIALDTEDCLRGLGVANVFIESTVPGALDFLKKQTPDLAILDYNLGDENSERVAKDLVSRGIPFWLATGYGEMRDRLDEIGARGLLSKPYGRADLATVIASDMDDA